MVPSTSKGKVFTVVWMLSSFLVNAILLAEIISGAETAIDSVTLAASTVVASWSNFDDLCDRNSYGDCVVCTCRACPRSLLPPALDLPPSPAFLRPCAVCVFASCFLAHSEQHQPGLQAFGTISLVFLTSFPPTFRLFYQIRRSRSTWRML